MNWDDGSLEGELTMDKTDIFIKSAKGEQEIATRVNKLPIKHRSVLIMIDGNDERGGLARQDLGHVRRQDHRERS